ncbi:MAG: CpsB/CapC family capsule biosynthesis tyrosine phosphatase [Bacteroidota bacterium]|nr:CpsB/CapC family capsule biosynthesis tyrosine phosphatase [Bacteroidota bacterium]
MFSWLTSSRTPINNLHELQLDMHCHLLPGIDDGPESIEESLSIIQAMVAVGYQGAICTSHIFPEVYDNKADDMLRGVDSLQSVLDENNINFTLHASAEYMVDRQFIELAKAKKLLAFGKKDYVVIETGFTQENPYFDEAIYEMQYAGYCPILAHPERYLYLSQSKSIEQFEKIIDKGIELQINLFSLIGLYGRLSKEVAEILLKNNFIQWIGTDIHRSQHISLLAKANDLKTLSNSMRDNPIQNKYLAESI